MSVTLPAGWKRRVVTGQNGAWTVSLYAGKVHLGQYRFDGYGPNQGWQHGTEQYPTEDECLAALLEELTE